MCPETRRSTNRHRDRLLEQQQPTGDEIMRTPKFSTLLVPVPLLFLASLASAQTGSPLAFESTGEHQGQSGLVV